MNLSRLYQNIVNVRKDKAYKENGNKGLAMVAAGMSAEEYDEQIKE